MPEHYQSMSHSKWDCKYHVVSVPKYRWHVLYGRIRQHLGLIFHELARQKECQILEGHVMSDHAHMMNCIARKHAVASVVSFLKGKSAIAIARQFQGWQRNFKGKHFGRAAMQFRPWFSTRSRFAVTSASRMAVTGADNFSQGSAS